MTTYIIRRLAQLPVVLILVTTVVFFSLRLAPGDPVNLATENIRDPAEIERIRHAWGLDQPLIVQYVNYIGGVLHGDFGHSFFGNRAVSDVVQERYPATLELTLCAMVIGCVLGIALGIASAVWRNSPADLVARLLALFGISTPSFWLGLMLISVFSVQLAWLPAQGRFDARTEFDTVTGLYLIDALLHSDLGVLLRVLSYLVLPATVLGVFIAGVIARITRASVLDALEQPYVVVARAKGLRETAVIVGHGLRNALLPIVTLAGLQFGSLLGGAAITETVFAWPGLGRMLADAIFVKDYPQVQASVLLIAATYVVVNTAVDLLYAIIDPRVARQ